MFFGFNPVVAGFLTALLTAALMEEVAKYIFFRLALLKNTEAKSWHDMIIAAVLVGLGFTVLENIEFAVSGGANCPNALELAKELTDKPVMLINTHGDGVSGQF